MRLLFPFTAATAVLAALLQAPAAAAEADPCAEAEARYAKSDAPELPPGTVPVLMYKNTFCPHNVTVPAGTTVRWINVERTSHTVWLKEQGEEESDRIFLSEWWEFPFPTPGVYPYLCGPHWENEGMAGSVIVE
ncbi:cupredoxin domain-containing protein [Caenispirillum bisanense]|uniref:cupredoxin domain-containing protein n=1 Tax=Caenispirillum bisanense TaxID=414052 RepID=UPI0031DDF8D8